MAGLQELAPHVDHLVAEPAAERDLLFRRDALIANHHDAGIEPGPAQRFKIFVG